MENFFKKIDKNTALIGLAIVAVVVVGVLLSTNGGKNISLASLGNFFGPSNDEIAKKAVDYINNSGLSSTPASLVSVSEESGLVKIKIKIGSQEFDSYATKDGKFLLPQAFDISGKAQQTANNSSQPTEEQKQQAAASIKKTDKPLLEAFVVARCPYGLQMQRAMADAVNSIPDLAQYLKVLYIGSVSSDGKSLTSMHGDAEAKENLRQICIREEQPAKYWNYVACQMKGSGQEVSCEKSTGVDSAKLNACVSNPARGIAYAKKDFDLNTKYNVQGSPTLVLSDAQISESGFGGRSSDGVKSMVCAAFNNQPGFCSKKLNTAEAATSFSPQYSGSASGSGNSGATGTNCAPAK